VAYELAPLPYAYNALEPHIDEATMKLHHDKHHQAYVTNLNGAIDKHPELASKSPEDLIRHLTAIPEDIRKIVQNNGGGHVNHTMFWQIMKPAGGGPPHGPIAAQIRPTSAISKSFKKLFNETTAKAVRLRLGMAGRPGRQAEDRHHGQPGQPLLRGALSDSRQRRLGARLLPQVPEPPPRVPGRLVEHRQLGRDQQTLRHRPDKVVTPANHRPPSRRRSQPHRERLSGGTPAASITAPEPSPPPHNSAPIHSLRHPPQSPGRSICAPAQHSGRDRPPPAQDRR